jgi:spectinomycin phosphotransferase
VLTPPEGFPDDALAAVLAQRWGLRARSLTYRPVGFGSHHWEMVDADGRRWFVTVDDLQTKRCRRGEALRVAFDRLRAALAVARDLRDQGATFVVAPVPTGDGEPVAPAGEGFAVAVYPFLEGQTFGWGDFSTPGHLGAVLELVVATHTAPAVARRHALADDFSVAHRDELEAALDGADDPGDCGPYARPAAALVTRNAAAIRAALARYDGLVTDARDRPSQRVLTHGEPHPGNTMLTADGWRLLDWDTALLAAPERDLWHLDGGDGRILDAYARATGVTPSPALLRLYRLRWDLADIAVDFSRFRRRHTASDDDTKAWHGLRALVARLGTPDSAAR